MEFKVGDSVRRNKEAIDSNYICGSCVVNGIPQICEVLSLRGDDVYVKCPDGHTEYFNHSSYELVEKSNYKPKNPTHLVVWEEDRDPCKFFESEDKAKEFIKELSEKSNVTKDSIVLVEIKSARKIKIQKSLRYLKYTI